MTSPHVAILMPVKDGAQYLPDQLQSIRQQSHSNWTLLAGDDGSRDDSRQILRAFSTDANPVHVLDGPGRGCAANTLNLILQMQNSVSPDSWIALSDQDDYWFPDRLSRGINAIGETERPTLYCSRTVITDAHLKPKRLSRLHRKPPSFGNALVQNIASGNTILLNSAAADLIQQVAQRVDHVIAADWLIYQIITGANGRVIYDHMPTLLYRQHGGNQFGENSSLKASTRRAQLTGSGHFRTWIDCHLAALGNCVSFLEHPNEPLLSDFVRLRKQRFIKRIMRFPFVGVHRQTRVENCALWALATLSLL